jgi:hypothetical protein
MAATNLSRGDGDLRRGGAMIGRTLGYKAVDRSCF